MKRLNWWKKILILMVLFQGASFYLGTRDMGCLRVGMKPKYSTTAGVCIFDGGSAVYWGFGYTIAYHWPGVSRKLKGCGNIAHAELWYWIPLMNFPGPMNSFIDIDEVNKLQREFNPDRKDGEWSWIPYYDHPVTNDGSIGADEISRIKEKYSFEKRGEQNRPTDAFQK